MIVTVEPDEVSVAEPVTVYGAESGEPGHVPVAPSVAVLLPAIKLIFPDTGIAGPEVGVSVKL